MGRGDGKIFNEKIKPCSLNLEFNSGTKGFTIYIQMPDAWSFGQINFV